MFNNWKKNIFQIKHLVEGVINNIDLMSKNKALITGEAISSGFQNIDRLTEGFRNGTLTVIAGRPSMGKTAFLLSTIQYLSIAEKMSVLFFSLDMTKEELTYRILISQAKVDSYLARTGNLEPAEWSKITAAASRLSDAPIFIDESVEISINELCQKARRIKAKENIKLIIIDYLQLMYASNNFENKQNKIAYGIRLLKTLAKDLKIPILLTSQLSRKVESRKDHRPHLSDLMELGVEIQNIDTIMLLFREEYYNPTQENRGLAEVIISKNREGPVGVVSLNFFTPYARFEDIQTNNEN